MKRPRRLARSSCVLRVIPPSEQSRTGQELIRKPVPGSRSVCAHVRQPGGNTDRWRVCEHRSPWSSKASSSLGGTLGSFRGAHTPS